MPLNDPFAGSKPRDPFAPSHDPFAQEEGQDRGFFGTLIQETIRDVVGAGRTARALAFTPLRLLHDGIPYRIEDLDKRDIKGALMMLALGVGGVVAKGAQSLPLIARIGSKTVLQRLGTTAATEAAAGAAFELVRPLEEGQARLDPGRIAFGATAFGAFGAGASMLRSAWSATVGGAMSRAALGVKLQKTGEAYAEVYGEKQVGEFLGTTLYNPQTGSYAQIFRSFDEPKKVTTTYIHPKTDKNPFKASSATERSSFQSRVVKAFGEGYTERMGDAPRLLEDLIGEHPNLVPSSLLNKIREGESDLARTIEGARLGQYKAIRDAAYAATVEGRIHSHLFTELVSESTGEYVPFVWRSQATKLKIIEDLPIPEPIKQRLKVSEHNDAEVLRQAVLHGVVDIQNIKAGVAVRDYLREVAYNGSLPTGAAIIHNPALDAVGKWFLSSTTIAKLHPVILPLVNAGKAFAEKRELGIMDLRERLYQHEKKLLEAGMSTRDIANPRDLRVMKAAEIIDVSDAKASLYIQPEAANAHELWMEQSRKIAKKMAAETGDPAIQEMVNFGVDYMESYYGQLFKAGVLGKGIPGYLNIVNNASAATWKLDRVGPAWKHGGEFFESFDAAHTAGMEYVRAHPNGTFSIVADQHVWDVEAILKINKKDFPEVTRKMIEATRFQQASGFRATRKVGIRDFENVSWLDRMEIYGLQAERLLARKATNLEKIGRTTLNSIPGTQPALKSWANTLFSDLLGLPRQQETWFQNIMRRVDPNVKPQALNRYAAAIRSWESFARLSGPWSGIVNITQTIVGTLPVLGPYWTTKAIFDVVAARNWDSITAVMKHHKVDINFITPLSREGGLAEHATIKGLWKRKEHAAAINAVALFFFNGAEKVNRVVAWWGGYQRALSKGIGEGAAAREGTAAMFRTQFDYSKANMPEILRGPIGSVLGQFKSFFLFELEFIAGLKGKERLEFAAAMQALGGAALLFNVPGVDLLNQAKGMFFDKTLDEDITLSAKNGYMKWTAFGFPGLVNIDLSDYVGVSGFGDLTRGFTGPGASDFTAVLKFAHQSVVDGIQAGRVRSETQTAFLNKVLPSWIKRIKLGHEIAETGEVRNPYSQKLIYRPADRLATAVELGFGAPPLRLEMERAMDRVVDRVRTRFIDQRTAFLKDAALAFNRGDREGAQRIMAQAQANGFPVDGKALRYWIRSMQKTAAERRERRTPVALRDRDDLMEYFEINGTLPVEAERSLLEKLGLGEQG